MTRFRLVMRLATLCFVFSCVNSPTTSLTAGGEYTDDFISCWDHFDTIYCYFPRKGVDWQYCYQKYLPDAMAAVTEADFQNILMDMLGELRDAHVGIQNQGGYISTWSREYEPNYSNTVTDSYFESYGGVAFIPEGNFHFCCHPDVSYFRFPSWSQEMNTEVFQSVFDSLAAESQAIIIDVRMNGGGNSMKAREIAERFCDEERTAFYVRFRDGPDHDDFTELYEAVITPGVYTIYPGQVFVLQGRGSVSSCELFLCYMGVLPTVITVGERSYGGSGNPVMKPLPNGWQVRVPTWIDYTAELQVIEWSGIEPDVYVSTSPEDFQNHTDPILDYVFDQIGLD